MNEKTNESITREIDKLKREIKDLSISAQEELQLLVDTCDLPCDNTGMKLRVSVTNELVGRILLKVSSMNTLKQIKYMINDEEIKS